MDSLVLSGMLERGLKGLKSLLLTIGVAVDGCLGVEDGAVAGVGVVVAGVVIVDEATIEANAWVGFFEFFHARFLLGVNIELSRPRFVRRT